MTRELIERLEALAAPDHRADMDIYHAVKPPYDPDTFDTLPEADWRRAAAFAWTNRDYTHSLDGAAGLAKWAFPGAAWTLGQNVHHGTWSASLNRLNSDGAPESFGWGQHKSIPSIALVCAVLSALPREGEQG